MKEKILRGEKKQTIRPLHSPYWLRFKNGDRLVGYWKMRTKNCKKLFDSLFIQDPFTIRWDQFTEELMRRDGFKDLWDAQHSWFLTKYWPYNPDKEFVVIRWR